jgi:hypothetical protein
MILIDYDYRVVELNRALPSNVYDWLVDMFGPPAGNRWFYRHNKLYFANSKEHTMFVLRWS